MPKITADIEIARPQEIKQDHKPSQQQQAVLNFVKDEKGSLNLVARAGCGKTSTLEMVVKEIVARRQGQVALLAYNKAIATELKYRLEKNGIDWKQAEAGTVHSFGFRSWKKIAPNVQVEGKKVSQIALATKNPFCERNTMAISRLVSLAKQLGMGFLHSTEDSAVWFDLVEHFDADDELADGDSTDELVKESIKILKLSFDQDRSIIDFDDMILAPLVHNAPSWQYDFVLLDEAQDTNPTRRALAKKLMKPKTGRLIAVGDPRQAIYGFCHPPGTLILTPDGQKPIETLKRNDPVIVGSSWGETSGWKNSKKIIQTHKYIHDGNLLTVSAGKRKVEMTPHHKVPIRINSENKYYTYIMERKGIFRVGSCQAFLKSQKEFMLRHRAFMEEADSTWILEAFVDKQSARNAEKELLKLVKGTGFHDKSDAEIKKMPSDKLAAVKILLKYGRMLDFPFLSTKNKKRVGSSGVCITEACNILPGWLVAFHDTSQEKHREKSFKSQKFIWTPCAISSRHYRGPVFGITVPSLWNEKNTNSWPLYFGGEGKILVHNTGADATAMDIIQEELGSKVLPLTVTYRCPKEVVKEANALVPDFQAHESAPQGKVKEIDFYNKEKQAWYKTEPLNPTNSFILCRNTKPLVQLAYQMLREGIGCRIEGREIGEGLVGLAMRWKSVSNVNTLSDRLRDYEVKEKRKWIAKGKEGKAQDVEDKVQTLQVLIERCVMQNKYDLFDLVRSIRELFGDTQPGQVSNVITLSTIHKSKGREMENVYLFDKENTLPSKYARKEWQLLQEQNLEYVAITRSKQNLIYVRCR